MKRFILLILIFTSILGLPGCAGSLRNKDSLAPTLETSKQKSTPTASLAKPAAPTLSSLASQNTAAAMVGAVSLSGTAGDFLAPVINGLNLKPDQLAGTAEYLDSQGRSVLLVEALPLNDGSEHAIQLKKLLDQIYGPSSPYAQNGVYPRFRYPLPGIQAGFFAVDANLSASQVLLLKEALDLFSRPVFADMQPDLFDPGIAYVLIDKISGDTAGLTYAGTGVVELDRRDLFGNKYLLASVIAHEGSHVLQGAEASDASCADRLQREVGNQTIPGGFYQWDAATLLQAIKNGQIGAYHVSLWMLTHLGIKNTGWVVQAIRTGLVDGQSVVNCKL
jgi:hypothetical protein